MPGNRPEMTLTALAERLGAVYEGSCWRRRLGKRPDLPYTADARPDG